MIEELMKYFEGYSQETIISTLFEMNRYFDRDLKNYFSDYKKEYGRTFNSFERKILRNYFYCPDKIILETLNVEKFPTMQYTQEDLDTILQSTLDKINTLNSEKIIDSIKKRIEENNKYVEEKTKCEQWLAKYSKLDTPALIVLNINQELIDYYGSNYESNLYSIIGQIYERLNNYRYTAIIIKDELYYNDQNITWELLSNIAVYMENFISFDGQFYPFKRDEKIKEMVKFLQENITTKEGDYKKIASSFYETISTGFTFSDLLISEDAKIKILIMRKIELDNTPILCPSCMKAMANCNSYPMMFQKSWECENPLCPERSKSGRGKRYDEYGTYRYFKLVEGNTNNIISDEMYKDWRRDIFDPSLDYYAMLILYYSWNDERVEIINDNYAETSYGRNIFQESYKDIPVKNDIKLENLKIYKLLEDALKLYKIDKPSDTVNTFKDSNNKILVFNENSTLGLKNKGVEIECAVTSPPYYNAREYSQWSNLVLYLIDMMYNAKSVYDSSVKDNFTYLYNVGDIVDADNIYVSSNMSRRRIMLGFYSTLIFKLVGFNLVSDIIWDKGEVESKRNSSVNLYSGYVKYVNCYEHVLVFQKQRTSTSYSKVCKIKPVIKINCKGENILGHTAPYPEELVQLIEPFIQSTNKYILDPFLGSGTTAIWCRKNYYNFIGFELNEKYFELTKKRIHDSTYVEDQVISWKV